MIKDGVLWAEGRPGDFDKSDDPYVLSFMGRESDVAVSEARQGE